MAAGREERRRAQEVAAEKEQRRQEAAALESKLVATIKKHYDSLLEDAILEEVAGRMRPLEAVRLFKAFREFCTERGLTALPAAPAAVCWYLDHIYDQFEGLEKAAEAISETHKLANLPDPTNSVIAQAMLAKLLETRKFLTEEGN
jgi:hypothetical protein